MHEIEGSENGQSPTQSSHRAVLFCRYLTGPSAHANMLECMRSYPILMLTCSAGVIAYYDCFGCTNAMGAMYVRGSESRQRGSHQSSQLSRVQRTGHPGEEADLFSPVCTVLDNVFQVLHDIPKTIESISCMDRRRFATPSFRSKHSVPSPFTVGVCMFIHGGQSLRSLIEQTPSFARPRLTPSCRFEIDMGKRTNLEGDCHPPDSY